MNSKPSPTILLPEPVNGYGFDYLPQPEALSFTAEDVSKLGQTVYNRFHYVNGMLMYNDERLTPYSKSIENMIRQVIDSLNMNGYKISKVV